MSNKAKNQTIEIQWKHHAASNVWACKGSTVFLKPAFWENIFKYMANKTYSIVALKLHSNSAEQCELGISLVSPAPSLDPGVSSISPVLGPHLWAVFG